MVVNKVIRNIGRRGQGGNMFSGIKKMRGAAVIATSVLVLFSRSFLAQIIPKAFPTTKAPSDCGVGVVPHGDENLIVPPPDPTSPPPPPRPTFPTFQGTLYHQRLPYPGPSSCCEVLIKISGILPP